MLATTVQSQGDLWPHQHTAVTAVAKQIGQAGRATVVAACGTGKTRIAATVAQMLPVQRVLVVVPTLELLAQTVHAYRVAYPDGAWGRIVAVCSDETITRRHEIDLRAEHAEVIRDPAVLAALTSRRGRCTVATTYASLASVVADAHRNHGLPPFDLVVVDEAHRTAGEQGKAWAVVHDDGRIPAKRRLYLTATPRIITASSREQVQLASMDDEAAFGPVVYELPFAEAIDLGLLADYRVLVSAVAEPEVRDVLRQHPYLRVNGRQVDAATVAAHVALLRAADTYGIRRVISFHSRVSRAGHFAATLPRTASALGRDLQSVWATHLSATHRAAQRREVLDRLRSDQDHLTVVANARLLSEGIDIPAVDAVVFADPRGSTIDAIQAVGRALRRGDQPDKIATVILPVLADPGREPDLLDPRSPYAGVWEVLRALRAHDTRAAAALDELRRQRLDRRPGDPEPALPGWLHADGPPLPDQFVDAITVAAVDVDGVFEQQWQRGLAAASAYRQQFGHLRVLQRWVTAEGFPLGAWINTQRVAHARGRLPAHRVAALDELGMVWDARDEQWAVGYAAAEQYAAAHGHLHPIGTYVTEGGFRLGQWLTSLRRRGDALPQERQDALSRLDPLWNPPWPSDWHRCYLRAKAHYSEHGHVRLPQSYQTPEGYSLGKWLSEQRRRASKLNRSQRDALRRLGLPLDGPSYREQLWQEGIAAAEAFREAHGHLRVPRSFVTATGFKLGQWLERTRRRTSTGTVTPQRAADLERIGVVVAQRRDGDVVRQDLTPLFIADGTANAR